MKKRLLNLLVLASIHLVATAQPTSCNFGIVLSSTQAEVGDTVSIEVSARNFTDILGLQYNHQWNPAELQFVEVLLDPENIITTTNFTQNPSTTASGLFGFSWYDPNVLGYSIDDGVVLYTLRFIYLQEGDAEVKTNGNLVPVEVIPASEILIEDYFLIHGQVGSDLGIESDFPQFESACVLGQACNDPQTGSIEITASGSGPLEYGWTGPGGYAGTGADIDGLQPGEYTMTITQDNDREVHGTFLVLEPTELQLELSVDGDECGGIPDGRLEALISGGSGDYSFNWSNGVTGPVNADLIAGDYSVTVTDNQGGCTVVGQSTVHEVSLLWVGFQATGASCTNGSDGAIDLLTEAPAEYLPLSFSWSNGATTEDLTEIPAGIYSVDITGANACTVTYYVEVPETDVNSASAQITPTSCLGDPNGAILVELDEAEYTFNWTTGDQGSTISNLAAGSYGATITNINTGCSWLQVFEVPSGELQTAVSYECLVETNFETTEVSVLVWNSSDAPYTFFWSTGEVTTGDQWSSIVVSSSGDYSVTVVSSSECSTIVEVGPFSCDEPPVVLSLSPQVQNVTTGEEVCLDVEVENFDGIAGFQYSLAWDPEQLTFTSINNFTFSNLNASSFNTQVADDGFLPVVWLAEDTQAGETLIDGASIYEVCWEAIGSGPGSIVSFGDFPTTREFVSGEEGVVPYVNHDANIQINQGVGGQAVELAVGSAIATTGENICLPITVDHFVDIAAFQFSVKWDPTALQYSNAAFGSWATGSDLLQLGLNAEALQDGRLRALWVDISVEGESLLGNTTLAEVCFNVIGGPGVYPVSIDNMPLATEFVDNTREQVGALSTAGTVQVQGLVDDAISLALASVAVGPSEPICVPVIAESFIGIQGAQFSISWDDALVQFDSIHLGNDPLDLNPSNFNANAGQSFVSFAWTDPNLQGVTLAQEEALFELCFTAGSVEGSSGLTFGNDPTPIEFVRDTEVIPFLPTNGLIEISSDGLVWPGDTDLSEQANNFDLLNIGLAFGEEGAARSGASIAWLPQYAAPWAGSTPVSGVNHRHLDTNGDGVINASDTLALSLNWGQTLSGFIGGGASSSLVLETGPPIYVQPDTVEAGSTISLPVILGTDTEPVNQAYGLAFTVLYDAEMIVPGSVSMGFDGWLGNTSSGLLGMYRDQPGLGRVEVAMVRTDGLNVGGEGTISNMTITMEDVIFRTNIDVEVVLEIVDVRLITYAEIEVPTSPRQTITLVENVTNVDEPEALRVVKVSPNPTDRLIQISAPGLEVEHIEVLSISGQRQLSFIGNELELDLQVLPAGTYWLGITTDQGTAYRSFIKK